MDTLLVERDTELPGLVTITLNRPEKLNAINNKMHDELQQVCIDLQTDYAARVVILTGAGRAFSSGADLASRREGRPSSDIERWQRATPGNRTCALLESLDQVTIAALNGLAVGGGVVFATCADIRLASENAWFSIPEVDIELPLTWGALPRLMREIGPARTKELVMSCDRFTASEAMAWGWVQRLYPDDQVVAEARRLAAKLLAKDQLSLAMTKSTMRGLEQLMVPAAGAHGEREQMLLAYQMRRRRDGDAGDADA